MSRRPDDHLAAHTDRTRRQLLLGAARGMGALALGSLLSPAASAQDGSTPLARAPGADPLLPRPPHFAPRAKQVICIFLAGGPSQFDLFDPKPRLNELHGQPAPAHLTDDVRFAFIQKGNATLRGTDTKFRRYGECGMELAETLPHLGAMADDLLLVRSMHTDEFNHHPAQLLMQCGRPVFGLPTMGSWVLYGLGSESRDLPGYVVLSAGRGASGGSTLWQSGHLPSSYAGVPFRSQGPAVVDLASPPGVPRDLQGRAVELLGDMDRAHLARMGDPEIAGRVAAYELAFRMQLEAPGLLDLSDEPEAVRDSYGLDRPDPVIQAARPGGPGQYRGFATNCLLARRMVERGVRFVSVLHATWDHHSNLDVELPFNTRMADQPIGALLADLKQRGLLDETLVILASEFGRTPLGENRPGLPPNTGRDHHPKAFSIALAGGGIPGGQVYGETDELGWGVVRDPVHVNDFHATVLHLMGLDHLRLTHRFNGRDFRLTDVAGRVIPEWIA